MSEQKLPDMKSVAAEQLGKNRSVERYGQKGVGWIGMTVFGKTFVWQQKYFNSGNGYAMSKSLYKQLKNKSVDVIVVPPSHDWEVVDINEFSNRASIVDRFDSRFRTADEIPSEDQLLFSAKPPA